MKRFPIVLLYLAVPALVFVGMQESARHDRSFRALAETAQAREQLRAEDVKALHKRIEQQSQSLEAQVTTLQDDLRFALATSRSLQNELVAVRSTLKQEIAARETGYDLHSSNLVALAAEISKANAEISPLKQDLAATKASLVADIEAGRQARQQLSAQYNATHATQGNLVAMLEQLASARRARAVAQQQIADQLMAEAEDISRLVQRAGQTGEALVATEDATVRVAEVVEREDVGATSTNATDTSNAGTVVE